MSKLKIFDDLFSDEPMSENDKQKLFSEEEEKEKKSVSQEEEAELTVSPDCWKVLVVDDEEDIHAVTRTALKGFTYHGKGIEFYDAYTAKEAEKILKEHPGIALILLDVVMETNQAGLDLVKYIRGHMNNQFTRIILRTGQPGHAPEREVIVSYEIDDYKTKTELTSAKLFTVALASLRAYETLKGVDAINIRLQMQLKDWIRKEKDLILAKEKAEQNERIKMEFIEQLTEQIKGPIDIILDSTLEIRNEINHKISEDIQVMFDKMTYTGKRIVRTVQLILDLSEVHSGNYNLKPRMVDIKGVCEELIDEQAFRLKEKNIKVVLSPETKKTLVKTDEYSIRQVLNNLTDNAIKFTDKGNVEINLSRNNNDELKIEISDTGVGISRDFIPEIFKPFTRETEDFDHKHNGIGLGLALTKVYCKLNKINISVESRKGRGSVFRVVFTG